MTLIKYCTDFILEGRKVQYLCIYPQQLVSTDRIKNMKRDYIILYCKSVICYATFVLIPHILKERQEKVKDIICDPSRRNGHVGGMTPNSVIDTS